MQILAPVVIRDLTGLEASLQTLTSIELQGDLRELEPDFYDASYEDVGTYQDLIMAAKLAAAKLRQALQGIDANKLTHLPARQSRVS